MGQLVGDETLLERFTIDGSIRDSQDETRNHIVHGVLLPPVEGFLDRLDGVRRVPEDDIAGG